MATPKRLVLVRHGESEYNASMRKVKTWLSWSFWRAGGDPPGVQDARLTPVGEEQARALGRRLAEARLIEEMGIGVCLVSPLTRAVQTALLALRGHAEATEAMRGLPIVPCACLREFSHSSGDVGRPPVELQREFEDLDFSGLREGWWRASRVSLERADAPRMYAGEPEKEQAQRVREAVEQIRTHPETNILVVGHSKFFMKMTGLPKLPNCGAMEVELEETALAQPECPTVPIGWSEKDQVSIIELPINREESRILI